MSRALIDKLTRARERLLPAGRWNFTIRRPTDAEALQMQGKEAIEFVHRFVVGWDLVEADLISGGGPEKVPFDRELWCAWVDDQPDLWMPIAMAAMDDFKAHVGARESTEKN